MKQKYVILKDDERKTLIIKEFAETDKDILVLVYEDDFEGDVIKDAIKQGKKTLISALRSESWYPPEKYMDEIADLIVDLYDSEEKKTAELILDDKETIIQEEAEAFDGISEDIEELDQLLGDDSGSPTKNVISPEDEENIDQGEN